LVFLGIVDLTFDDLRVVVLLLVLVEDPGYADLVLDELLAFVLFVVLPYLLASEDLEFTRFPSKEVVLPVLIALPLLL
jgi:hypothetical protein